MVVSTGREQVFAWAEALERLTEETGQEGAALGLRYVLEEKFAARKVPHLVCFLRRCAGAGDDEKLVGAAVLFEYVVSLFGIRIRTGLFATGDSYGVRTVLGAENTRCDIAAAVCIALLRRGARMVLVSFKRDREGVRLPLPPSGGEGYQWAQSTREVQDSMEIAGSLDETLASLGKRTRTRLRSARRRFDATVSSVFVRDAINLLPLHEDEFLLNLNKGSLDPIEQSSFNLQLRATAQLKGGFVCGLRSAEHGWIALLGGWRQGRTTWVEWQVNQCGFERFSITSVLRSYLLEDEARQGTLHLGFHGSTSHSMAHSFRRDSVTDLIGRRRSLLGSMLIRMVPLVLGVAKAMAQRGNFLADALNVPGLAWTPKQQVSGLPLRIDRRSQG